MSWSNSSSTQVENYSHWQGQIYREFSSDRAGQRRVRMSLLAPARRLHELTSIHIVRAKFIVNSVFNLNLSRTLVNEPSCCHGQIHGIVNLTSIHVGRAKFIVNSAAIVRDKGGPEWLFSLRNEDHIPAREQVQRCHACLMLENASESGLLAPARGPHSSTRAGTGIHRS